MNPKKNTDDKDEVIVWSPNMPERRQCERRSGYDRRQCQGKPINVPSMRGGSDRRQNDRRKTVSLTITGRAMNA